MKIQKYIREILDRKAMIATDIDGTSRDGDRHQEPKKATKAKEKKAHDILQDVKNRQLTNKT